MVIQKKELLVLLKPYYWVNIILTCSYVFCKKTDIFCQYLFSPTEKICELDAVSNFFVEQSIKDYDFQFRIVINSCYLQKELEILLFLMIVVMIRTRKAGSVTMLAYLSSSFLYTKGANVLLWFYADVRYGLLFTALIIGMLFLYFS